MFYQNLVVDFDGCPIESLKDRFVLFGLVKNVSLEGPGLVLLLSLLDGLSKGVDHGVEKAARTRL